VATYLYANIQINIEIKKFISIFFYTEPKRLEQQ